MLRLDYEALEESARKLIAEGDNFEDSIKAMDTVIQGLPDIWEADTCDKYVEQFNDFKPDMQKVRELIQEMSDQMTKIANNFREADQSMAGQM